MPGVGGTNARESEVTAHSLQQDRFVNWSIVSAVNNEAVLESCLLSSPDVSTASEVILQMGYSSIALAYNAAIDSATTDLLVFAHQDVYLPRGWSSQLSRCLAWLSVHDPQWAVAGVWGRDAIGGRNGHVYCAGLRRELGKDFSSPIEIRTLDELLLIVRKSSGVRFDEALSGFHMYGADICLEAQRRGMKCYAISAFCIHNTNGYDFLPFQFWKNYLFMRKKWKGELPITTSCTEITSWCWPMIHWNMTRLVTILRRRHYKYRRLSDPQSLYRRLVGSPEQNSLAQTDRQSLS